MAGMKAAKAPGVLTATNKRVEVRIYGATAVVTVVSMWVAGAGSAPKHTDYVATHVWNRQAGRWRLVAAHISRLL
jgi:ketosteroid isomerase-like protein